jgi:hypothetical protein
MMTLYAETDQKARASVVLEFKKVLTSYLENALGA